VATYYIGADVHCNNTEPAIEILVFDFEIFIGFQSWCRI